MKINLKYPFLTGLLMLIASVALLTSFHIITGASAIALLVLGQLAAFALCKPKAGVFYLSALTDSQIREFEGILNEFKGVSEILPDLKELAGDNGRVAKLEKLYDDVHGKLRSLSNRSVNGNGNTGVYLSAGGVPHVSDDCAKFIGSMAVIKAVQDNKLKGAMGEELLAKAASYMRMETKAAIAVTDIPLPDAYGTQIVELVYIYGSARKNCTVYPLSTNSMKLPRLKTGEPQFGFIAISGAVPEKVPQIEYITFTPGKAGGIVRIPSEIDADSLASIGQFVARYIAREMAVWEDTCLYLGDGTSTYNSIQGIGKQATTDGNVLQLAATNSSSDKITLANIRQLRTKTTGAVLNTGKYYAHPTMEALFVSFNTSATVVPYMRKSDGTATFDGFPIVWVSIMPVYSTSATLNAYQIHFGDLSWWYFGERMGIDVVTSRDVYFATDEIGIRALERFDIHGMGQLSTTSLQLSAS